MAKQINTKGKVIMNEFASGNQNIEGQRNSESTLSFNCGGSLTIECRSDKFNAVDFTDASGNKKTLLLCPLIISLMNQKGDCVVGDYRTQENQAEYVTIRGFLAEPNVKQFAEIAFSVFPENEFNAIELYEQIIAALKVCACFCQTQSNCDNCQINVENGIVFDEESGVYRLGGMFNSGLTVIEGSIELDTDFRLGSLDNPLLQFRVTGQFLKLAGLTEISLTSPDVYVDSPTLRVRDDSDFLFGTPTADGAWRQQISGTDFLVQRREAGVWVTKLTIPA